jgi:hypothetical protein
MVILMTFSEIVLDARKSQNHTTLSPAARLGMRVDER